MRNDYGNRQKRNMGGAMKTARKDMAAGYYPSDMGMAGGAMYKKVGKVINVFYIQSYFYHNSTPC